MSMLPTAEDYENVIETLEAQCEALQVERDDLQKALDRYENRVLNIRDKLIAVAGEISWY
jgi:prefoldin subunit 5